MPSQSSLLTTLLAATALLWGGLPVAAQTASTRQPYGSSLRSRATTDYTVLHVNPLSGDDQLGDGTQYQPFKTITQALQSAESGTVILLAPGRYTAATGESFPLQLKPGVTLQGQPTTAQSVLIQGGGQFDSPSLSEQNAAVVMADRSGLAYVVVSNPTAQGHGVWVESGQPVIRSSAFVASEHTGLYVAGGSPTIEGSYFSQNEVAGLVLYGQSQAVVRGNQFENTGAAITVAAEALPEITDNRIIRNDEGLVLLGHARPAIANNQISQNRRNSVVEISASAAGTDRIAAARPVPAAPAPESPAVINPEPPTEPTSPLLASRSATPPEFPSTESPDTESPGTARPSAEATSPTSAPTSETASETEPNRFEPNRSEPAVLEPDTVELAVLESQAVELHVPELPTAAPESTPLAAPPEVARPETAPDIAAAATLEPEQPVPEQPVPEPVTVRSQTAEPQETESQAAPLPPAEPQAPSIAELRNRVGPSETALAASTASPPDETTTGMPEITSSVRLTAPASTGAAAVGTGSIDIAVVPAETAPARPLSRPAVSRPASRPVSRPISSPVSARPSPRPAAVSPPRSIPESDDPGDRLSVPGANIPIGSSGVANQFSPPSNTPGNPPAPPSRAAALGLTYRVFVEPRSARDAERIRELVPDAFRTQLDGQPMMQVGAYADEATAQERRQLLLDNGWDARVEYLP